MLVTCGWSIGGRFPWQDVGWESLFFTFGVVAVVIVISISCVVISLWFLAQSLRRPDARVVVHLGEKSEEERQSGLV